MFRFEDNVSKYLVNESRDFQLMCRMYDVLYMGQRSDIQTMQNLNNPYKCKTTVLQLLAAKVGFFTDAYIEENALRNIVSAFKYVTKKKGTLDAVKEAVTAVLKAEQTSQKPVIIHVPAKGDGVRYDIDGSVTTLRETVYNFQQWERNHITIVVDVSVKNVVAITEFLKYVIPYGYTYSVQTSAQSVRYSRSF